MCNTSVIIPCESTYIEVDFNVEILPLINTNITLISAGVGNNLGINYTSCVMCSILNKQTDNGFNEFMPSKLNDADFNSMTLFTFEAIVTRDASENYRSPIQ